MTIHSTNATAIGTYGYISTAAAAIEEPLTVTLTDDSLNAIVGEEQEVSIMANETLDIYQGDTVTYTVTVKDSAGDAYDLGGFTPKFTVKTTTDVADDDATISKEGSVTGDGSTGIFTVPLTNSDTDVTPGSYVYDFQIDDGSSIVKTILKGTFNILTDVTNISY